MTHLRRKIILPHLIKVQSNEQWAAKNSKLRKSVIFAKNIKIEYIYNKYNEYIFIKIWSGGDILNST